VIASKQWIGRGVIAAPMLCSLFLTAWATGAETGGARRIDTARSKMTVRVFKSGFFSAFAHNHEIEAPIESGEVNEAGTATDSAAVSGQVSGLGAELRVDARKLRVLDPEASTETRAKIQATMLGPQVLDTEHYPEIHFKSTVIEPRADSWVVRGMLELHGQSHPVEVEATLKDGVYRGTAALKQTAFGIKPVSIAGGTVNVKDEVRIEFEIALMN